MSVGPTCTMLDQTGSHQLLADEEAFQVLQLEEGHKDEGRCLADGPPEHTLVHALTCVPETLLPRLQPAHVYSTHTITLHVYRVQHINMTHYVYSTYTRNSSCVLSTELLLTYHTKCEQISPTHTTFHTHTYTSHHRLLAINNSLVTEVSFSMFTVVTAIICTCISRVAVHRKKHRQECKAY